MTVFEDYNTKLCVILIVLSWVLISLVAAFWHYSHGQTMYLLFLLVIPIWMLIKIRWEESVMNKG
jgi:hypothetical protein